MSRIAVREDMKPQEKEATFIDIAIWGSRAQKLSDMLKVGKSISVTGRLEINKNKKNDRTYVNPRVVVNTLEFLSKKNPVIANGSPANAADSLRDICEDDEEANNEGA